ncbi:ImmA/IrrE family metallo-endopeptidase [Saccharothrix mutabilis subsp. mutabilis]|uniref:ImmA/IrrE family metallo-endopeptidase n=1 Tax=Saccharothrix mutabilis subsp. mutabilis TaxID=66855 RepID=A0ABN0UNR4_9PSEU
MTSRQRFYAYQPESFAPPGETLKEYLDEEGISQADLCRRTGLSTKHINQIVQGAASLSPETAVLLDQATGIPAIVWSRLEAAWQVHQSEIQTRAKLEEHVSWVSNFPLGYLHKMGILRDRKPSLENLQAILKFFGVASPDVAQQAWREYRTAFRRSTLVDGDEYAVATWLRLCEKAAREVGCSNYNKQNLVEALPELRKLTMEPPQVWIKKLPDLCSKLGIALVFKPALKNTHVSGATRWLTPEKAMVALSDRFKTDDTFWFSFFHEIGHLILHGKRLTFLDENPGEGGELLLHGDSKSDRKASPEIEADNFARNALIPDAVFDKFVTQTFTNDPGSIARFARKVGVSQGIVLGRLQHEGIVPWSRWRDMKQSVTFSD